jgi:hypothetical protein
MINKVVNIIIYTALAIIALLLVASFWDIIRQNNFANPSYASWNIIVQWIMAH